LKHFISLLDYSTEALYELLHRADYLAKAWRDNKMPDSLRNKQVGIWFYGNGFRNRVAFEIGLKSMGASVAYIPGELGVHEPLEDIIQYLCNWFSLLVVRAKNHQDLLYLCNHSCIPVINARTTFSHPCEIMGDLQFIRHYRGSLDGLNVVFVGEVTNICMSWFEAAVRFPIQVTQVAPAGYEAGKDLLKNLGSNTAGKISVSNDLDKSIAAADLIYTDCWPSSDAPKEKERIKNLFLPYQITGKHLSELHSRAMFLPCPPVTRGQEVSADAMNSDKCMNFMAKDFLLHSQNAIAEMLISDNRDSCEKR
jgi:ornithine carbamoyltransferase